MCFKRKKKYCCKALHAEAFVSDIYVSSLWHQEWSFSLDPPDELLMTDDTSWNEHCLYNIVYEHCRFHSWLGWAFLLLVFYNNDVRLHSMINNIRFGCVSGAVCSCLLPESLQVTTVKQSPEYYECVGISLSSLLKVEIIKVDLTHKLGPRWLKS